MFLCTYLGKKCSFAFSSYYLNACLVALCCYLLFDVVDGIRNLTALVPDLCFSRQLIDSVYLLCIALVDQ